MTAVGCGWSEGPLDGRAGETAFDLIADVRIQWDDQRMVPVLSQLEDQLKVAWSVHTATTWTRDNPARGQCSVTALVVNDVLGGRILKTKVGPHDHFYNWIDDRRVDLTSSQFEDQIAYEDVPSSRDDAFHDTTFEQYQALRRALSLEPQIAG